MSNDAKRASNARYLEKFKTVSVRVNIKEELPAIQARAEAAGLSLAGYMLQAAKGELEQKQTGDGILTEAARGIAERAADLEGKTPEAWLTDAIMAKQATEAEARRFREELKQREEARRNKTKQS